jgi:hypothetical protein
MSEGTSRWEQSFFRGSFMVIMYQKPSTIMPPSYAH